MAYGRKDYFWGVAPEKSVFGENQAPKTLVSSNSVTPTDTVAVGIAIGPVGYIWHITSILVMCDHPGLNEGSLYIDTTLKCNFYLDGLINIALGEGGVITVLPLERFEIRVTNLDTVDIFVRSFTSGFLQLTIS